MPLPKNLEELLKHMDPTVAAVQRDLWEKNPAIAKAIDEGTVPQAEFSRQLNAKDTELKAARDSEKKIRDWEKENRPRHDKALQDVERLEREKAALERQVTEAAGRRTGEEEGVNADELAKRVEERLQGRMVSEETTRRIIGEEREKLKGELEATLTTARKDFLEKTFPLATNFQADLLEVMQDYKDEFGKKLDRKEFAKFMEDNSIIDPKKAFDEYTKGAREEKRIAAEVDKRVNEAMGKKNMPGVTPGQEVPTDMGPLQLKISGETPKFKEGSELGDRSAAAMAAAELRQEGTY